MRSGKRDEAKKLLSATLQIDPKHPDARFLSAELALAERNLARGQTLAKELAADRHDGYSVQMLLAEAARMKKDVNALRAALEAAHRFDPTQAEPVVGLSELMRQSGNLDGEIEQLKVLVKLEQHEPMPYRRCSACCSTSKNSRTRARSAKRRSGPTSRAYKRMR
jgi:thioredoxin-like negative regulator of GroEL